MAQESRPGWRDAGRGSLYNALGILFALGLLRSNPLAAVAVILMFGLGMDWPHIPAQPMENISFPGIGTKQWKAHWDLWPVQCVPYS